MKREVDHVGDGVDGEAREGLGERRREALAMGLLVFLPTARGFDAKEICEAWPKGEELPQPTCIESRAGAQKDRDRAWTVSSGKEEWRMICRRVNCLQICMESICRLTDLCSFDS